MAKKLQHTSMSFLQNRKVCFNQKNVTNNLPKFASLKSDQTQKQIPKLTRISTHKLQDQIFTERWYIPSGSQIQHNSPKYPGEN